MTRRIKRSLVAIGFCLGIALAYGLWYHLFRREPAPYFASDADHFKYGSLNTGQGFPLYIWEAMLEVFPELMPADGMGLTREPGKEVPVGFSVRVVGFPGLNANCAVCHCGAVRTTADAQPHIYPGAPAHQFDFQAFQDFAVHCAEDKRFNGAHLLPAIRRRHPLGWFEGLVYRFLLIPGTRKKVLDQRDATTWVRQRPPAGPGRTDAFNRLKIVFLGLPDDGTIDLSDSVPLWHQRARVGLRTHWNGAGTRVDDDNLLSVATLVGQPGNFDAAGFARVTNYLWNLPAPAFPYPVDSTLVSRGEKVYRQYCAECHAFGSARTGGVHPPAETGTDPEFLQMWTPAFQSALRAYRKPPFEFGSLAPSDGYISPPLDGCWLRAPYLHNGSVPSLAALLQPPAERPRKFFRGGNLYDPVGVGFVSLGTTGEQGLFLYDTTVRGSGNQGHGYGTDLPAPEKLALLEYLKTL